MSVEPLAAEAACARGQRGRDGQDREPRLRRAGGRLGGDLIASSRAGGRWLPRRYLIALSAAAALLASGGTAAAAAPSHGAGGLPPPAGGVSATPASNTPHLQASSNNPVQQIRQLVQCGPNMYAVGSFSKILKGKTSYTRSNIFSFKATAPYTVTSWAPVVVGTTKNTGAGTNAINSIAFNGGKCANAYIGGNFSSINGTTVKNIAEISTSTGNVVGTFGHNASGAVQTLVAVRGHLLAGGNFTSINGSGADSYLASLSPVTGKDDGFVKLGIHGNYQFPGVSSNATKVYNQELSHGGTLDLVMGDFTTAGGLARQQIFMLNVAAKTASVTSWTSPEWDGSQGNLPGGYPYQCATVEPYYIKAAAWSADDSVVYIGTTGYHPWNVGIGSTPRSGLCDVAAAFPAKQQSVLHLWIDYTGCDSLYAAAADASTAYFGGHERWAMNPVGCDFQGSGAIPAPGMLGLSPATGELFVNQAGTAGYYSRGRGLGAVDMERTSAGLWIASDNFQGTNMCGGVQNLSGICFLPHK